jgi:nitrite reductase/ring-hydroxylating ferredoxin subunit
MLWSSCQMASEPRWRDDFPVSCDDDAYATRREFMRFLGLTSVGFFLGTCAAAVRGWWVRMRAVRSPAVAIAELEEIPVGGCKVFRYPTENDPCILLRLQPEKFVAFNQSCTHLACPVHFDASANQLVCPCHLGFFSVEDGRPIAGPPKRPLTKLSISVQSAQVWVRAAVEERT